MTVDLSVSFTGIKFENPFLLSSAPPTESESNIMRAFDAGWGGVVVKTIGMHPVVNVAGPKTKFLRSNPATGTLSMNKGREGALHSSWNWELISDKPLDWWIPRLERIKKAYPTKVLIASIMAGSGSDKELDHWRDLTKACQDAGADGIEMNLSCPHMDRADMGSNIGKDQALCSFVTQVVKDVARVPVWAKLTPASADMTVEAGAGSDKELDHWRDLTKAGEHPGALSIWMNLETIDNRRREAMTGREVSSGTDLLPGLLNGQDGLAKLIESVPD